MGCVSRLIFNAKEKINVKRNMHDKRGSLNHANAVMCKDNEEVSEEDQFDTQ